MEQAKKGNISNNYKKALSNEIQEAISFVSKLASQENINAYLIGGIVRDIILGNKGFDIDITLETDAIDFAKKLENNYENCFLKETHKDFKTAKIAINNIDIDLASTRKETYVEPASLPVLEKIACPIKDDVIRRDFTINTLGISLNKNDFGELIDCFNGLEDINNKKLKTLHDNSFIDDPTRILRMLKFSIRFNFEYEKQTKELMEKVLNSAQFDNMGSERVKLELKQTFNLNSAQAFDRIIDEKIYTLINTGIKPTLKGEQIKTAINYFKAKNIWLIYLSLLLLNLPVKKIESTSEKLNLNNFEKKVLQDTKWLFENTKEFSSNYEIYNFFKNKEFESIVAYSTINKKVAKKYLNKLSSIKIKTTGETLLAKGVKQGKEIGIILDKLLEAKVNEKINDGQEEEYLSLIISKS